MNSKTMNKPPFTRVSQAIIGFVETFFLWDTLMNSPSNTSLHGYVFEAINKTSFVFKPQSYMGTYEDLVFDNDETGELRVFA